MMEKLVIKSISHLPGALFLCGMMAVTSCSDNVAEATLSTDGMEAIVFSSSMDAETRSGYTNSAILETQPISVTALYRDSWDKEYYDFSNVTFSPKQTEGGTVWASSPVHYWRGTVNTHFQFFAYAPADAAGVDAMPVDETYSSATPPTLHFTVADNAADQEDLIVAATAEYVGNCNNNVALQFKHALAAVEVKVGGSWMEKVDYIVLRGMKCSGTYNFIKQEWQLDDTTFRCVCNNLSEENLKNGSCVFFMIPQELTNDVVIEYYIKDAADPISFPLRIFLPNKCTWAKGCKVEYTLNTTIQ